MFLSAQASQDVLSEHHRAHQYTVTLFMAQFLYVVCKVMCWRIWFPLNLINRSESVLLAYARKRLDQLTQELASYQTEEQKRLENSLKIQREEDAKLTELKLKQEADRMVSEFKTTLKKKASNGLLWGYYHKAFHFEDDNQLA